MDALALLLSLGCGSEGAPSCAWPPLVAAAHGGHAGCVAVLLAHGADPTQVTRAERSDAPDVPAGTSPLAVAGLRGHSSVVDVLLKASRARAAN